MVRAPDKPPADADAAIIRNASRVTEKAEIEQLGTELPPAPGARKPRGRPVTGKAMSNAERQRAYRERQKAQRHQKARPRAAKAERERDEKAGIRLRELERQLTELQALYQLRSDQLAEWMADNRKLKEQLAQRQGHSSELAIWWAEIKLRGSRTWERLDSPIMMAPITEHDMKTWMRDWKASAGMKRRAARDDGMIYEPQDAR